MQAIQRKLLRLSFIRTSGVGWPRRERCRSETGAVSVASPSPRPDGILLRKEGPCTVYDMAGSSHSKRGSTATGEKSRRPRSRGTISQIRRAPLDAVRRGVLLPGVPGHCARRLATRWGPGDQAQGKERAVTDYGASELRACCGAGLDARDPSFASGSAAARPSQLDHPRADPRPMRRGVGP